MQEGAAVSRVVVIDGYIDEPASLGVPPFISPLVRATFGAALAAGGEVELLTIDQLRRGSMIPEADLIAFLGGSAVPGRYLRGMPASQPEMIRFASAAQGGRLLGGPAALQDSYAHHQVFDHFSPRDPAASVFDLLQGRSNRNRWRTLDEWNRWLMLGAEAVLAHPDFPQPLIAEMETYRGCIRYKSGGCSFCVEPLKGRPVQREPGDVVAEARRLVELGVRNFRIGAQTCIVSYQAIDNGTDTPVPSPQAIEELLRGIADLGVEVLHLDNANPAVIAAHPEESRQVLESMARHCTPGNVLALGMESADPKVVDANNLNATPEQVLEAIRLINQAGGEEGSTGLPKLLPGLNFIIGLDGESPETLSLNLEFLREVRAEGLLLRRINIRQVMCIRRHFEPGVTHSQFLKFKETVRREIDQPTLRDLAPKGRVLRRIYTEIREGNRTFGRQIGTYPLLVGFNYPLPLGVFVDAMVVDWGFRSLTAVEYPLKVNGCPMAALESLPSIGKKRAMRLLRHRPFRSAEELKRALDDDLTAEQLLPFLSFE